MDAFSALADPVRRSIVEQLAGGPLDVGSITDRFPISQPAISRHLRHLRDAELVAVDVVGQRRVYSLRDAGFATLEDWVARYRPLWEERLERLAAIAEEG